MSTRSLMAFSLSGVLMLGGIALAQESPTPAKTLPPTPDAEATPAEVGNAEASISERTSVVEYSEVAPAVQYVVEAAPTVECCPIAVVNEHSALSAKRMYRCHGATSQTLCVDNPADCCCKYYGVTVCVPCCCTGEPVCCGTRVGLLGRGYVTYRWSCGFEATIAFRVAGGVIVTYR